MTYVPDYLPCWGKSALFEAADVVSHQQARAICLAECTEMSWCRQRYKLAAAESKSAKDGPEGTWFGELKGQKKRHPNGTCGTPGGYRRHQRHKEQADDACLEAWAREFRQRRDRQKESAA